MPVHYRLNLVSSKHFGKDMCRFLFEERVKLIQRSGKHQFLPFCEPFFYSFYLVQQQNNSVLSVFLNRVFPLKIGQDKPQSVKTFITLNFQAFS